MLIELNLIQEQNSKFAMQNCAKFEGKPSSH